MTTRDSTPAPATVLIRPFRRFFELEASSGLLLLAFAVAALVWANSPFAASYFRLWQTPVTVEVGAWPYAVLGLALWIAVLKSGIHATVAGVLLAFTIPARRVIDAAAFAARADALLAAFRVGLPSGVADPTEGAAACPAVAGDRLAGRQTPLQRLEHALHPWVAFFIMPVFALANAGVAIGGGAAAMLVSAISLAIVLGLVLGKRIGILLCSWLAVRLRLAALPEGVGWPRVWGVSLLCGIGLTTSLFIASLALVDAPRLDAAKIGVLAGSVISGLAGAWVLMRAGGARDVASPD